MDTVYGHGNSCTHGAVLALHSTSVSCEQGSVPPCLQAARGRIYIAERVLFDVSGHPGAGSMQGTVKLLAAAIVEVPPAASAHAQSLVCSPEHEHVLRACTVHAPHAHTLQVWGTLLATGVQPGLVVPRDDFVVPPGDAPRSLSPLSRFEG